MTGRDAAPSAAATPAPQDAVPGRIQISNTALAKLAARAAVELPTVGGVPARGMGRVVGLRGGEGRSRLPRTSADIDGRTAFIDMTISVRWPAPLAQVTAALRQHLRARVRGLTELTVAEVRLTVAELTAAGPPGPRVR